MVNGIYFLAELRNVRGEEGLMKRPVILLALIILCNVTSKQILHVKAQSEPKQIMYSILRDREAGLKLASIEIREYTHPLLKKYLPDYKFYIPYIPPYKGRSVDRDGKEKEVPVGEWYLSCLGIVDRRNRLSMFDNLQVGKLNFARAFLKTASIKRGASSRTDNELREIASMFLILSSLKGLNGYGFIEVNPMGLPTVKYIRPEDFQLTRGRNGIIASYKLDNDKEILDCSLSFDLNGNVTRGEAYHSLKTQAL
jgi:hypothetical protein